MVSIPHEHTLLEMLIGYKLARNFPIHGVDSVLYADPQSHIKGFESHEERQQALEGTKACLRKYAAVSQARPIDTVDHHTLRGLYAFSDAARIVLALSSLRCFA